VTIAADPLAYVAEHCPDTKTGISNDEAFVVLEPYYAAAREIFEIYERERWPTQKARLPRVRLEIARWIHDSPRHFAATADDGSHVIVAPEMTELPEQTVLAIFSHEFGHAIDMIYAPEFFLVDGELRWVPIPGDDDRAGQARVARMKQWERRDRDTVEMLADAIAEHVTGTSIGYSGPCLLQSFGRGEKRPAGLR